MIIKPLKVTVRELVDGYRNGDEEGVVGYGGRLDIRPKYQREFVYKDAQRNAVVGSVMGGFPLSVFYWCVTGEGTYEVLDGQQRTISICEFVAGSFSVTDGMYFANLPDNLQERFLDYELMVYVCDGTASEKLDWFKVINIAGEKLTDQELRNAVYAGSWVSDAKRYFSKTGCAASAVARDYLKGSSIRQEYLQTALSWAADAEGCSIEDYMARHQHDASAQPLWSYFRSVIDWVQATFTVKRAREMRGVPWGPLYNRNRDRRDLDPAGVEEQVRRLMGDPDVTRKAGIYEYVLEGDERKLSIRQFNARERRAAYERQGGVCAACGERCELSEMHADHIKPWSKGGATVPENCQMLCRDCNLKKSND